MIRTFLFLVLSVLTLAPPATAKPSRVSPKCLAEIRSALEYAESEELPPTKRSAALPVECQYHFFRELDEELRTRIQNYLGSIGKSATLDQKLTEVLTLIKSKSLKIAPKSAEPPSRNWLYAFDSKNCHDYTGRPLQECEAGNYATTSPADCETILEYSKKCKALRRCNPRFKPTKTCTAKDFSPPSF